MNNIIGQSNFLQALGWAVLNSLWQMALLWVVYQLITGIARKTSASQKSSMAAALVIAGFGWFIYTFFSIYLEKKHDAFVTSGFINIDGNPQLNDWLSRTLPVASLIYLLLLILPLVHFIRNYRFVQVIRNEGLSKAGVEWRMFVKRVSEQLGIRKPVHIWLSSMISSPVTIGYLKPIILVPIAAVNHLSTVQLEAVLLHELAHIRRYDYFVNLILKFIQSILYYNPFVKAFVQIVEREREKSCDELVMQFQYDPHGYATALLELERSNSFPKTLAVAASGKKTDLLHRIEWIMGVDKKPVVSFNKLAGMFAGLLCVITINALVILSKPVNKDSLADSTAFSAFTSPLYFFTNDFEPLKAEQKVREVETAIASIVNKAQENIKTVVEKNKAAKPKAKKQKPKIDMEALAEKVNMFTSNPYAAYVAYIDHPEIPVLTEQEEKQVKKAVAQSKKVIEEGQWKEVEKTIAEVFTQQQKEELKSVYNKAMSKMDWKKLENKLRLAYDQVDWERVNAQLGTAVNTLRMDSIQRVYIKALDNLSIIQKELTASNITAIPDSDISICSIEQKKNEVQKALNKLKVAKVKKVVHL